MRFLTVSMCFLSSISMAAVEDFNGLIGKASVQERRLHRKLLQSIQNTQISIAYNDRLERLQRQGDVVIDRVVLRLVSKEESHK